METPDPHDIVFEPKKRGGIRVRKETSLNLIPHLPLEYCRWPYGVFNRDHSTPVRKNSRQLVVHTKPHISIWWITANTNVVARDQTTIDYASAILRYVVECCFVDPGTMLNNVIEIKQDIMPDARILLKDWADRTLFPDDPNFPETARNFRYREEVGHKKKGRRVHLHGILKIIHYTYLTLNTENLRKQGRECLQQVREKYPGIPEKYIPKNIYFHVRFVPAEQLFGNYMIKADELMYQINQPQLTQQAIDQLEEEEEAPRPRRGRGRPRKIVEVTST